jgi:hypothetical protein
MIGAAIVIASGLLVQVADRDIDWFDAHPKERAEMLKRCHADYQLADTPECMNAEASGTRELGRMTQPIRPASPAPATKKGGERAS